MNKDTFLNELAKNLSTLSEQERNKVLDYYREMICDEVENGKSEETVIQDFGSPHDIAAQICAEYSKARPADTESYGKVYSPEGTVNTIQLSAQNIRVEIREVPDGNIRVLFNPISSDLVTVTEQNNIFTFTHTIPFQLFSLFNIFHMPQIITLEIPKTFSGSVSAKTSNARLTAENLHQIKNATFTTSNAHITVTGTECAVLQIHTSNAKIELSDCKGNTCNAKTDNGRIVVYNCTFPAELNLHTNNSSINADAITSDNIQLKTANASINAAIAGDARDYSIHSHTSNGRNNLPADWSFPGQTRRFSAETSNAHIDVKFTTPSEEELPVI
jgi:DUF4097 and DUF4098 domain-containing protein YvlB